jgi:hypothetical protein
MMMKSVHGVMWNLPRGLLKSYLGVYLGYELSKIKAIDTLQKGYMWVATKWGQLRNLPKSGDT